MTTDIKHLPHRHPESDKQRIENGFALLDGLLGEGWALLIDTETFNIWDGNQCVLGQVFRSTEPMAAAGYDAFLGESEYDEKTGEWKNETLRQNLNGFVQDFLFENTIWPDRYDVTEACGFDGGVGNDEWLEAIIARQEELGGAPAVEAAQEYLAKQRPSRSW